MDDSEIGLLAKQLVIRPDEVWKQRRGSRPYYVKVGRGTVSIPADTIRSALGT
jgi:hypothetical protein